MGWGVTDTVGHLFMSSRGCSLAEGGVSDKTVVFVFSSSGMAWQVLALLEGDYALSVTRVNVLEGEDSEKKIKQMKTFSGANTVPQVRFGTGQSINVRNVWGGDCPVRSLRESTLVRVTFPRKG